MSCLCCDPFGNCHPERWCCAARTSTQQPPKAAPLPRATPWLNDITPTSPVVDDQDEDDDTQLANFALCLMGGAALIFVTGFSLGYLLGG